MNHKTLLILFFILALLISLDILSTFLNLKYNPYASESNIATNAYIKMYGLNFLFILLPCTIIILGLVFLGLDSLNFILYNKINKNTRKKWQRNLAVTLAFVLGVILWGSCVIGNFYILIKYLFFMHG
jgi:hypothetical protein